MIKEVITIGSFLVGGAGAGVIVYMNSNPYAFLREVQQVPPVAEPAAPVQVPATVPADQADKIVYKELALVPAKTPPSRAAARVEKTPAEAESAPVCDWRSVGVHYVDEGKPTGLRRVRDLCE